MDIALSNHSGGIVYLAPPLRLPHVQLPSSQILLLVFSASIATIQEVLNLIGGCADLTIYVKKVKKGELYYYQWCFLLKGPGVVELF